MGKLAPRKKIFLAQCDRPSKEIFSTKNVKGERPTHSTRGWQKTASLGKGGTRDERDNMEAQGRRDNAKKILRKKEEGIDVVV